MHLIITRPREQALPWVQALQALGLQASALPLIDIGPLQSADAHARLQQAWADLALCTLVVFVSPNAVAHFFAQRPAAAAWPATLQAGSTGPGTTAALRAQGLAPGQIVQPRGEVFDSEALWQQLAHRAWAGQRVRVVRGEEGRDWLAESLRGQGALVDFVSAYQRRAPRLDAADKLLLARALAEPAAHLWVFSSSQAVAWLAELAPRTDWAAAQAAASHPRIAASARALGFGRVHEVAPTPQALHALLGPSIQSAPT